MTSLPPRPPWKTGLGALVLCGVAHAGCTFLDSDEGPIARGEPYHDPVLVELLCPSARIESQRLVRDASGVVTYEARLADPPASGYLDQYTRMLTTRGVLVQVLGGSPHAVPARVLGYGTLVLRRVIPEPFTIQTIEFSTRDDERPEQNRWRNAPNPFSLEGAVLTFRLGRQTTDWTDRVLAPTADVEDVPELPFARFPGAVLTKIDHPSDFDLLERDDHVRTYLARDATMKQVVSHYLSELRRAGVDDSGLAEAEDLDWRGPAVEGITRVVVSRVPLTIVPGRGLGVSDLRKLVPGLLDGLPADLSPYMIVLEFSGPAERLRYLSPGDRRRHEELTAGREDP